MEDIDLHYLTDIKFGFAFFNFSLSLFPPNLMFIVEALGFKAGKSDYFDSKKKFCF